MAKHLNSIIINKSKSFDGYRERTYWIVQAYTPLDDGMQLPIKSRHWQLRDACLQAKMWKMDYPHLAVQKVFVDVEGVSSGFEVEVDVTDDAEMIHFLLSVE